MINKGYNLILYNKRKEAKLTLSEASILLKINFLFLFFIERGYFLVPKKKEKLFIETYHLEDNFFEEDLLFPLPLPEKKKDNKFLKIVGNLWFKIIMGLVLAASLFSVPYGNYMIDASKKNNLSFYGNSFNELRVAVIEKGTLDKTIFGNLYTYSFTKESEEYNQKTNLNFYSESENAYNTTISYQYQNNRIDSLPTDIYFCYGIDNITIIVKDSSSYSVTFSSANSKIKVKEVIDENGKEIDDQNPYYYIYSGLALSDINFSFPFIDSAISDALGKSTYTTKQLLIDIQNGYNSYKNAFSTGSIMMVIGIATLIISLFGVLASFIVWFMARKVNEIDQNFVDDLSDMWTSKNLPLPKNKAFPLVIPETLINIIIIVLVFLISLTAYRSATALLSLVGIGGEIPSLEKIEYVTRIKEFTSNFICVALILQIFLKTDNLISTKKYLKNTLLMFGAGLMFYALETVFSYCAQQGLNSFASLMILFSNALPGNIFWGMCAFYLIAMFLFSEPMFVLKSKKRLLIWRLLVIIPLVYIFFSASYSIMIKKGTTVFPYYISYLFSTKQLFVSLFVVLYYIALFVYRLCLFKKYGDKSEVYVTGNSYYFTKNIIAASVVLIIGIFDIVIGKTMMSNETVRILKLGINNYVLCAIPLILFFRPHIGKRLGILDISYKVLYTTGYSLSYVLLAIILLPYISLLIPLLQYLLR